jgi:hypothetical protein
MFNGTVADMMVRSLGVGYLVIAFGLMGAVLLCLDALFLIGLWKGYGPRFGFFLGIAIAVWGSLCWFMVPWCGVYPNLPGAVIGFAVFGRETWGEEISLHVTNLLLWPFSGWALFRAVARGRSKRPHQDASNTLGA